MSRQTFTPLGYLANPCVQADIYTTGLSGKPVCPGRHLQHWAIWQTRVSRQTFTPLGYLANPCVQADIYTTGLSGKPVCPGRHLHHWAIWQTRVSRQTFTPLGYLANPCIQADIYTTGLSCKPLCPGRHIHLWAIWQTRVSSDATQSLSLIALCDNDKPHTVSPTGIPAVYTERQRTSFAVSVKLPPTGSPGGTVRVRPEILK